MTILVQKISRRALVPHKSASAICQYCFPSVRLFHVKYWAIAFHEVPSVQFRPRMSSIDRLIPPMLISATWVVRSTIRATNMPVKRLSSIESSRTIGLRWHFFTIAVNWLTWWDIISARAEWHSRLCSIEFRWILLPVAFVDSRTFRSFYVRRFLFLILFDEFLVRIYLLYCQLKYANSIVGRFSRSLYRLSSDWISFDQARGVSDRPFRCCRTTVEKLKAIFTCQQY